MSCLYCCIGNRTPHLWDASPTRQFTYSLDRMLTGSHVVYALIQLYMYSKSSMFTIDTAAVRIDVRMLLRQLYMKCAVGELSKDKANCP